MKASVGSRVLMLLENGPYTHDARVPHEAKALTSAGYQVSVICPRAPQRPWRELLDGVHIYRFPPPPGGDGFLGYLLEYSYAMVATFLLTGGRRNEVLGLLGRDVDTALRCVHFRPNEHRELKRTWHVRTVPLFDQLLEELEDWPRNDALLFPGRNGRMITDVRGALESTRKRAQIRKKITLHTLRHTYAAVRLQTLDRGAPVSPFVVMRELGHRSLALIERTYGHVLRGPSLREMRYMQDLHMLEMREDAGVAER